MDIVPPSWTPYTPISSTRRTPKDPNGFGFENDSWILSNSNIDNNVAYDVALFQGYSEILLTWASAACILFILIGVPGNLITVIALSRCKKVRNATAVFIINLSLSDLLFCCFNLPLAASTFLKKSWSHGELLCRLFPLLRYGLLAVSLFTVLSITINRYVMIGHPRIYPRIYRHRYLALMIASTWIGAFSALIPTWRGTWGTFGLDTSIGSCSILPDKDGKSPKVFLFIMAFIVPCFSIIICYARIFCIVRKTAFNKHTENILTASMKLSAKSQMPPKRPPKENSSRTSQEEPSNTSSSISYIQQPALSIASEKSNHESTLRPYLSKLKADELKFIDTSVESDLPATYSTLNINDLSGDTNEIKHTLVADHDENKFNQETNSDEKIQTISVITKTGNHDSKNAIYAAQPMCSDVGNPARSEGKNEHSNRKLKKSLKSSITRITKRKFRSVSAINTSGASVLYPGRMSQKDKRLLKMILVIYMSFIICYLPITITKIWKGVTEVHFINIMGYLLIYLTTCVNPIVYVVMSSEYRQAYRNLLMCKTGNTGHIKQTRSIPASKQPKRRSRCTHVYKS